MFRSIGLIVILAVLATGCSIIRATPTETAKTGTLTGVVTGPTGPVAGANVQAIPGDNSYHATQTDSQGYYSLTDVPVGQVMLKVDAQGYQSYSATVVLPDSGGTITQNVSMSLK